MFQSWSDGGARRSLVRDAGDAPTTYTATFVQSAAPAGLVAAYGFDAGSGSTVADSSGRGNNGTVSGAAWTRRAIRVGVELRRVNDWVTVPDAGSLDLTSGMTVEAWVRPSKLGGWRTVVLKERPGGIVYRLYADAGRPGGRRARWTSAASGTPSGRRRLPLNAWSHLAVTYDGAIVRLVRQRGAGGLAAVRGLDGGVDRSVADRRERHLG